MLLTKDMIVAASDLKTIDVPMPEWGKGKVARLREYTAQARDALEQIAYDSYQKTGTTQHDNVRATMVQGSLIGDDGELLFTVDEITELGRKSAKAINRLYTEAVKLNALDDESLDELGNA